MGQSCASCSTASVSWSTCSNRPRARLSRSAFWDSLARGICHKHTTVCDKRQSAPDFRRNPSRRSNSKLSFAFGESSLLLAECLVHASTDVPLHLAPALSANVRCKAPSTALSRVSLPPASSDRDRDCRRTPRHTTHHKDLPEHVTITRPHHPFVGRSLAIFGRRRYQGKLHLIL